MGWDAAMRTRWLSVRPFVVGGLAGAAAIVASVEINRHTSTEAFCGSCHSMAFMANDAYCTASLGHRRQRAGVRPSSATATFPRPMVRRDLHACRIGHARRDRRAHARLRRCQDLEAAPDRACARGARRDARAGQRHLPRLPRCRGDPAGKRARARRARIGTGGAV